MGAIIPSEGSKGTIVRQLDGKGTACWNFKKLSLWRRSVVTTTVVLEPPVFFGEVEEWADGHIVVAVVGV